MDILVLRMNGEMLPLEASRDVRDLERGVEGLVVIESGRCLCANKSFDKIQACLEGYCLVRDRGRSSVGQPR
jgi:hypothetical protein